MTGADAAALSDRVRPAAPGVIGWAEEAPSRGGRGSGRLADRQVNAAHLSAADPDAVGRAHTCTVTSQSDVLPVLVIDGASFVDFAGFVREFSQLLCHGTWNGSLDAVNDILRGGFGTPETGWVLKWVNSDSSRVMLGYDATVRWQR